MTMTGSCEVCLGVEPFCVNCRRGEGEPMPSRLFDWSGGSAWTLWLPNPCSARDPRLWLYRLRHRLTGPQRGCSCSRCFYHPRRRIPAREFYRDRVRLAELEQAVARLPRSNGVHISSTSRES